MWTDVKFVVYPPVADVELPRTFRHQHLDILSDGFGPVTAEHEFGLLVEESDVTFGVGDDQPVGQCFDHRAHQGEERNPFVLLRGIPLVQLDQTVNGSGQFDGTPRVKRPATAGVFGLWAGCMGTMRPDCSSDGTAVLATQNHQLANARQGGNSLPGPLERPALSTQPAADIYSSEFIPEKHTANRSMDRPSRALIVMIRPAGP
jgi:hypothetical protein